MMVGMMVVGGEKVLLEIKRGGGKINGRRGRGGEYFCRIRLWKGGGFCVMIIGWWWCL